jgi:hypothetical protein
MLTLLLGTHLKLALMSLTFEEWKLKSFLNISNIKSLKALLDSSISMVSERSNYMAGTGSLTLFSLTDKSNKNLI